MRVATTLGGCHSLAALPSLPILKGVFFFRRVGVDSGGWEDDRGERRRTGQREKGVKVSTTRVETARENDQECT